MLTHLMIVSRARISVNHAHVLSSFPFHYIARRANIRNDEHVLLNQKRWNNGISIQHIRRVIPLLVDALLDCPAARGSIYFSLNCCNYIANVVILLCCLW